LFCVSAFNFIDSSTHNGVILLCVFIRGQLQGGASQERSLFAKARVASEWLLDSAICISPFAVFLLLAAGK
jgi:hypothetical protein